MAKRKTYEYEVVGKRANIKLKDKSGNNYVCIIDSNKLPDFLNFEYAWSISYHGGRNCYYVQSTVYLGIFDGKPKYKSVLLHDFLLDFPDTPHIDHKNNNSLDNRVVNLRLATKNNNARNRKDKNINNTSGYRNVSWIRGFWRVQLQIEGRNHKFPEKFENVDEAGKFAEKMRNKYYGKFSGGS